MPAPILDPVGWEQVHATAVALGSLEAAAQAHGLPPATVRQRARRDSWLVGDHADQRRHARRQAILDTAAANGRHVTAQAVSHPVTVTSGSPETLDTLIREQGRQTRAMLAQGLLHAAGQARRTKHPLARARAIKAVTEAAATVHGWRQDQAGTVVQLGVLLQLSTGGATAIEC
jgi:hypothetical protein